MLSVTKILSPYLDFSKIRPDVLEAAADRGSRVHAICADKVLGNWVPMVPDDCKGFIESFDQWFFDFVADVHSVEEEFINGTYGFVGHVDLICTLLNDPFPTVVDYKTPVLESKTWRGQLAAYWNLALDKFKPHRCIALQLKRDGKFPKVIEYQYKERDYAAFLAALTAYRYFKE